MGLLATLLLIEDDPAIREFVTEVLTEEGYRVTTVTSAAEALATLEVSPFDLILTDALISVPTRQTDHWPLLDAIAAQAGAARLIIFTAHREFDFSAFRHHGFAALILKPFDLDELVAVVAAALLPRGDKTYGR